MTEKTKAELSDQHTAKGRFKKGNTAAVKKYRKDPLELIMQRLEEADTMSPRDYAKYVRFLNEKKGGNVLLEKQFKMLKNKNKTTKDDFDLKIIMNLENRGYGKPPVADIPVQSDTTIIIDAPKELEGV